MSKRSLVESFRRGGRLTRIHVVNISAFEGYEVDGEAKYFGYAAEGDEPDQSLSIYGEDEGEVIVFARRTVESPEAKLDITLMAGFAARGNVDVSSPELTTQREDLLREYCYPRLVPYFEGVANAAGGLLGPLRRFPALPDDVAINDDTDS